MLSMLNKPQHKLAVVECEPILPFSQYVLFKEQQL